MNKRHYEHTLPNIRGSLSNTYDTSGAFGLDVACCAAVGIKFDAEFTKIK